MAATALIFDVDGTIWDSYPWYAKVLAGLSGREADVLLDQLRAGRSIVTLTKRCGVSDARFRSTCDKSIAGLALYPSVRDTLQELARRGTRCAVVTSLPGRIVEPLLSGTGLRVYFPVIVHAGSVRRQKPNPAPLLDALHRMSVEADDGVFYVGDRANDAEAATRAGVRFAWAAYGYEDECPPGAVAVLREFREVLQL